MNGAVANRPQVLVLNNGIAIPIVGFGTAGIPPQSVTGAVRLALLHGYRLIDTATFYENEKAIGQALRTGRVRREEVFITSKVWIEHRYEAIRRSFERSLELLGTDYLDLYLIHWPQNQRTERLSAWRALERLHREGLVRAIGVCNFSVAQLQEFLSSADVAPAVNQVRIHPGRTADAARSFHASSGIALQAWAPLAQGARHVLEHPVITDIARRHSRTPTQTILRWHVELGHVAIPMSRNPEHIEENYDVFDFELSRIEVEAISQLGGAQRAER